MSRLLEEKLERIWKLYRAACPAPEPTAGFMPGLWAKIDARRSPGWLAPLRVWATRVAAAAGLAAALLVAAVGMWQPQQSLEVREWGYVDVLAQDAADQRDGDLWLLVSNGE